MLLPFAKHLSLRTQERAALVFKVSRAIVEQRFEDRLYHRRLTIVNELLVMRGDASETNLLA